MLGDCRQCGQPLADREAGLCEGCQISIIPYREKKSDFLGGSMEIASCCPAGTMIWTPDGLIPVEELHQKMKDTVINWWPKKDNKDG